MKIAEDGVVMVADGRKFLLLRNRGGAGQPQLEVERVEERQNPDTSEQGSDAPGRSFGSFSSRRSAFEQTDFHQIEEDRFAADAVAMLNKRALSNDFETLIIVAPPATLGEMRKNYHKEVEARLTGEIAKDLTGHPIDEIERIVADA